MLQFLYHNNISVTTSVAPTAFPTFVLNLCSCHKHIIVDPGGSSSWLSASVVAPAGAETPFFDANRPGGSISLLSSSLCLSRGLVRLGQSASHADEKQEFGINQARSRRTSTSSWSFFCFL
jgi:hypothetical protein